MERWGEKSCLTVPMQSVDGPMGLLTLWDSTRERHYSEDELALATSLAELAGEAVRSAKLLRRLRSLSETDSLTGLANHRKIHEFLDPRAGPGGTLRHPLQPGDARHRRLQAAERHPWPSGR